jgi:glycosyltransferase involved in cell wall biosynthesis
MVTYNEELKIDFTINHYKSHFSNCKIIIYDNNSSDNTVEIAKNHGCEIIAYNTDSQVNDDLLTKLKNNCWKNAETDWVLVCDPDELLDITEKDLINEETNNVTIIKGTGYNMIDMNDSSDILLKALQYGVRAIAYDKLFLFNKKHIKEINYNHGSHIANPIGNVIFNTNPYKLYHYHYININFVFERYQITAKRMSEINKKHGWGSYCFSSLEDIKQNFLDLRKLAIKVIE